MALRGSKSVTLISWFEYLMMRTSDVGLRRDPTEITFRLSTPCLADQRHDYPIARTDGYRPGRNKSNMKAPNAAATGSPNANRKGTDGPLAPAEEPLAPNRADTASVMETSQRTSAAHTASLANVCHLTKFIDRAGGTANSLEAISTYQSFATSAQWKNIAKATASVIASVHARTFAFKFGIRR